ncbi:hypothetical protein OTERR_12820 [Oryzomicrobium terrae]|uniref:Uncharacterized protein n=1 Tax=Oryzomicrobium terrae TaxID=1735038 RepID=A0A5C1E936_9RHOO|nr:hypothetical protein [Oryzomicrobium terrae]QEL64758.1 hypothetical protein OTERR_12820 [Oryzomicrobium terrae]
MTTKKSTTLLVFEAVQDLHAMEQVVTRETLAEHTGLKLTVIDDRIAILVDDGAVLRVQRGVFVPAPEHPPARPISKTILPGGAVKIEIGDDVLTLTPRESRMLGELTAGAGQQYAAVEAGHQAAVVNAELALKVKQLQRRLVLLEGGGPPEQLGLLDVTQGAPGGAN